MSKHKLIITVASWENRFIEGFKLNLENLAPSAVIMFFYKGYEDWTIEYRSEVKIICKKKKIELIERQLDFFSPVHNWKTISESIKQDYFMNSEILLDITTMPRETIWTTLFFMEQLESKISYVYYQPEQYNTEWLSADPTKPRLLYKLSGIAKLGRPTLLFITAGYDVQRLYNLLYYFEPQKAIIGINKNDKRNEYLSKNLLSKYNNNYIEILEIDTFDNDHGYHSMEQCVELYKEEYNLIFTSLGPKPTAISIYKLARVHQEIGLCYIPCRQFNKEYSFGIGEKISGDIEIRVPEFDF